MKELIVKWCPICDQDWIKIVKDTDNGKLYCLCSECKNDWDDASNINNKTCNREYTHKRYTIPEEQEIIIQGWDQYLLK